MKVLVQRSDLLMGLKKVSEALPSKAVIHPSTQHVLIKALHNEIMLCANNMEYSIEMKIPAGVDEEGSIAVPGKQFLSLISNLPQGVIELNTPSETTLNAKTRTGNYKIFGIPEEDYIFFQRTGEPEIETYISAKILRKAKKLTTFACAEPSKETRTHFTGVLISLRDGELRFVASDAQILSLYKLTSAEFKGNIDVIVPRDVVEFFDEFPNDDPVKVNLSTREVEFEKGTLKLISRTIEGPYPAYEDVIPKKDGNILRVSVKSLQDSLKRISIFSETATPIIKLELKQNEKPKIYAQSSEVGEALEILEDATFIGEDITIGLNPERLEDFTRHTDSDEFVIRIFTPYTPVRVDPISTSDEETHILLTAPIRIA